MSLFRGPGDLTNIPGDPGEAGPPNEEGPLWDVGGGEVSRTKARPGLPAPRRSDVASSLGPTVCDLQFAVLSFRVPATLGDPSRRREGHREEERRWGGAPGGGEAGRADEAGGAASRRGK